MMEFVFELPMDLAKGPARPSTQAVYDVLKQAILKGALPPNTKLPPTRLAGHHFGLSRNSIVSVYERLANEGLVVSRAGSGTFVTARRKRPSQKRSDSLKRSTDLLPPIKAPWQDGLVRKSMWFWAEQDTLPSAPDPIELRPGLVDLRLFPFDDFRRCMAKSLRRMERSPPVNKSPQRYQGNFHLRQAIVDHAALMRALVCDASDIIITSGAQQAFDLLARVFVEPQRTVVAVENPCYPPVTAAFKSMGAVIHPVPVDREGIIVDQIPKNARLIYVTPSNQFPLGGAMSAERRRQLHAFASDNHALIIEDDYDGEFRMEGEPLKTIYGPEAAELVFYVGTFSKCMFPSLRLGYLIAPEWAMDALVLAKNCTDWHGSSVIQSATALFIAEGYLSAHVARMKGVYRTRRAALIEAIDTSMAGNFQPIISNYGLHFAAQSMSSDDWDRLAHDAFIRGVQVHSLSRYYMGEPGQGLLFAVGAEPPDRLSLAIERLSRLR